MKDKKLEAILAEMSVGGEVEQTDSGLLVIHRDYAKEREDKLRRAMIENLDKLWSPSQMVH